MAKEQGSDPNRKDDGRTQGESGSRQMQGAQDAKIQGAKIQGPKIQGEGDYEAARRYRKDVEDYVEDEGEDGIAKKAKAAEKSLEGPEASELKIAEKKGEERARR